MRAWCILISDGRSDLKIDAGGGMGDTRTQLDVWARNLLDRVLEDDDAGVAWLASVRAHRVSARVPLVMADLDEEEALHWARTSAEMGDHAGAEEIVAAVLLATLGGAGVAQGAQAPRSQVPDGGNRAPL